MIRKKNDPNIRKKLWGGALRSPSSFAGSCGGAYRNMHRREPTLEVYQTRTQNTCENAQYKKAANMIDEGKVNTQANKRLRIVPI
jgi:hypothetical protein